MVGISVGEVWGIRRASRARLEAMGVDTVADLRDLDPRPVCASLTVVGERIIHELRGRACLPLDEAPRPLFDALDQEKSGALMASMDACNSWLGRSAVGPARAGLVEKRTWSTNFEVRSPRYTTSALTHSEDSRQA